MFLRKTGVFLAIALAALIALSPSAPRVQAAAQYVPMPDFRTMNQAAVTVRLQELDRAAGGAAFFKSVTAAPNGSAVVLDQTPKAGTSVIPGTKSLTLTWSVQKSGILGTILGGLVPQPVANVAVPDLRGKTRNEAIKLLETYRLRWQFPADTTGFVRTQSYPPQSSVPTGTIVVLTMGPAQTTVPPLKGLTPTGAAQALSQSSLVQGTFSMEDLPGATVFRQDPLAGSTEDVGSAVNAYFTAPPTMQAGKQPPGGAQAGTTQGTTQSGSGQSTNGAGDGPPGPQQVKVPNLKGKTEAAALGLLSAYGLRSAGVAGPDAGLVSAERPAAGTTVDVGSSVQLTFHRQQVQVPYLLNEPAESVKPALQAVGLDVSFSEGDTFTLNAKHVVQSQTPDPGSSVDPGSVVAVVLADAPSSSGFWDTLLRSWVTWAVVAGVGGLLYWRLGSVSGPAPDVPVHDPQTVTDTSNLPRPPSPSPALPECTLAVQKVSPDVTLRPHGQVLKFKVAFATRNTTPLYRMGAEPSLRRKNVQTEETR